MSADALAAGAAAVALSLAVKSALVPASMTMSAPLTAAIRSGRRYRRERQPPATARVPRAAGSAPTRGRRCVLGSRGGAGDRLHDGVLQRGIRVGPRVLIGEQVGEEREIRGLVGLERVHARAR